MKPPVRNVKAIRSVPINRSRTTVTVTPEPKKTVIVKVNKDTGKVVQSEPEKDLNKSVSILLDIDKVCKKSKNLNILESYLNKVNSKDLVQILKYADDVYYNDGKGIPHLLKDSKVAVQIVSLVKTIFTDVVYDLCIDVLQVKDPNNKYLSKVGAKLPETNSSNRKIQLPFPMASLNKIKPEEKSLETFLAKGGSFVVSDKVDGVSLGIDGNQLFTRGDGNIGQDITSMNKYLKLPVGSIQARGEIVMPLAKFKKYESEFSNPRNMVSGLVNSPKMVSSMKDATVLFYTVIGKKPSEAFKLLKQLGFDTPWNKVYKDLDVDTLSEILIERKSKAPYDMDGLVVSRDVVENPTSTNPKNSVAFKMVMEGSTIEAIVEEVEWNPSKHGYLKPRIRIKPVKLSGVVIKWCTGYNAKYIVDNNIGKGSIVEIIRSGDVIPKIIKVVKATKPELPKVDYEWNDSGVDIVLVDAESNDTVQAKKLTVFFRTLGVESLSLRLFTRLYEAGYNTPIKIIKLTKSKLMQLEGIQEKSASNILQQIQHAINNVNMGDLLFASGYFTRELGTTRFKAIAKEIPNFMELKDSTLYNRISNLPGFSDKTTGVFMAGLPKFVSFYRKLEPYITVAKKVIPVSKVDSGNTLSSKSFVFTGFRNKSIETVLEDNGATISNSLSRNTTILIVKDKESTSTKIQKAKAYNVIIMDLPEFKVWVKQYGIKI